MTHIRMVQNKNKIKEITKMKVNNFNEKRNVPVIHPGCSLAETGHGEFDDFDNPLAPMNIFPEGKNIQLLEEVERNEGFDGPYLEITRKLPPELEKQPSSVREEPLVTVTVPSGMHPITCLKEMGIDINNSWVFMNEDVVNMIRKMPYRYHHASVAYGEFFRFENFDTISLQTVKYYDSWNVLLNWEFDGEKFVRDEEPVSIIEVVMEK